MEMDIGTSAGDVRIVDFMPVGDHPNAIVRMVTGIRGTVRMRSELRLRFNYGAFTPWTSLSDGAIEACVGPDRVVLRANVQ
jgi:hypothetical protein